jgi:hypothetical protein
MEKDITAADQEKIKKNLSAWNYHFKPITIKKNTYNKCYFVYQEGEEKYIQMCENIQYLNGWLYGAVQAHCKIIKTK